ncbi:MAG: S1-like domain-containing RNA-binding protein [Bacteroidales bacterium]|nr:S1-like domain-containing RNA-binding protein [Bacteroidales bacterium]
MIELGIYNKLLVTRFTGNGLYLRDEEGEEVLLPNKYVPKGVKVDEELNVFVYNDSEDRPVATMQVPKITLEKFAPLKVSTVTNFGAFMDWGMEKELLVPFKEQTYPLQEGETYVIYLYLDEQTNRLVGSAKIDAFLNNHETGLNEGDEVNVMVYQKTEMGYKVIINDLHEGLVFKNEVFKPIEIGFQSKAYIKQIREDEKIDISLQKIGYGHIEEGAEGILERIKSNGGFLPLTDKSSPEEISNVLGLSKKAFKKAIGNLYKQKLVRIETDGVYLINSEEY